MRRSPFRVDTVSKREKTQKMVEEIRFKPFWEELRASIERHRISHLLHYTRIENVGGILKAGALLSRRRQAERGIRAVEVHGWGTKGSALDDYICLSLEPPTAFLKRGGDWIALLIAPEVLGFDGSSYVSSNSARESVSLEEIRSRCDLLSFEDLFLSPYGSRPRSRESEILVPATVPLRLIRTIVWPDRSAWWKTFPVLWKHRLRSPFGWRKTPRCQIGSNAKSGTGYLFPEK